MKLTDFPLLTDENINPTVVQFLGGRGFDVLDVAEAGLYRTTDVVLMHRAESEGRIIVTHDSDFGALAIHQGESVVGVVYVRPGHINPRFTVDTLTAVLDADPDLTVPAGRETAWRFCNAPHLPPGRLIRKHERCQNEKVSRTVSSKWLIRLLTRFCTPEKTARISGTIKCMAFLEIGRLMKRGFRAQPSDRACLLVKLSRFS